MPRPLPEHPDLAHLKRQAKALRDAARADDPAALARITAHVPLRQGQPVALSAAQWTLAREYGYSSWPAMKADVAERAMSFDARVAAFVTAKIGRASCRERV